MLVIISSVYVTGYSKCITTYNYNNVDIDESNHQPAPCSQWCTCPILKDPSFAHVVMGIV